MKIDVKFTEEKFPVKFDGGESFNATFGDTVEITQGYSQEQVDKMVTDAEEAGKQAEYDRFWDAYQQNGKKAFYAYAFYDWEQEFFNPKYPIVCTDSNGTNSAFAWSGITEILVDIQVTHPKNATYTLKMNSTFLQAKNLVTISKLILDENVTFDGTFSSCSALENLTIEGTIGNPIYVNSCAKLTHESLMSIINALKDYSTDTSGTVRKVTLGSTNIAKLTDEEQEIAYTKGWELI